MQIGLLFCKLIDLFLAEYFFIVFVIDEFHYVQLEFVLEKIQYFCLLQQTRLNILELIRGSLY